LPKTLAEIAIDAGLSTKANITKAAKLAEEKKQPLVVTLVRDLGVDELALVTAFGKQTRVPLIDPAEVQIDHDALRTIPRDVCGRLRVLPLSVTSEGSAKVLRLAMADPTDTTAVAEIENITHCEIDVCALPLSAIDELVDKAYQQVNTVVKRPGNAKGASFVTSRGKVDGAPVSTSNYTDSEVSVTAQIPLSMLQAPDDLETQFRALVQLLVGKGLITEAELTEVLVKLKSFGS
jgi:hypothetical protein